MKYTLTIQFLVFFFNLHISGHTIEPTLKFGKPSDNELKMTVYEPDTTATAIVLYDIGKSNYRYTNNEFVLITQRSVKIKILKSEANNMPTSISPIMHRNRPQRIEIISMIWKLMPTIWKMVNE